MKRGFGVWKAPINDESLRLSLAGLSIIAVAYGFARYGYGLFVPVFREEFGLSTEILGFISSGAYATYLIALLLAGFLSSRINPRAPVVLGGLFAVVGMVLIAFAPNALLLAVGVLLASTSSGWAWAPFSDAVAQMVRPEAQNRTLSIVSTGTTFGLIVVGPVSLIAGSTWRAAWLVFAVLAFASTVWNFLVLPNKPPDGSASAVEGKPGEELGDGSRDGSGDRESRLGWRWFLGAQSLPLFFVAFAYGLAGAFYWTYAADLTQQSGLPPMVSSVLWTVVGIAGIVGLGTGDFVGRFGLRRVLAAALAMLGTAIAVLGAMPASWTAVGISAVIYGPSFMMIAALLALWSSHVFPERPSTGFTATLLMLAIGSIAGPATLGIVAGHLGLVVAFLITAAFTLLSMLVRPREEMYSAAATERTPAGSEGGRYAVGGDSERNRMR